MWRLASQDRMWYEWIAQAYTNSTHSSTSTSINGRTSSLGPDVQAPPTPTLDAFMNPTAPATPHLHSPSDLGTSTTTSRTLTGLSALMNPGGRSSCVQM